MKEIPKGKSREDIKIREKIIKDFYAKWISEHPDKKIWNKSLKDYIRVKFLSINETVGRAAGSPESTAAVLELTSILSNAEYIVKKPRKENDQNQKSFSHIIRMRYKKIRLIVGLQKSNGHYVQYCISSCSSVKKNKSRLGRDF